MIVPQFPDELPQHLQEVPSEKQLLLEGQLFAVLDNDEIVSKLEKTEAELNRLRQRGVESADFTDVSDLGDRANDTFRAVAANQASTENGLSKKLGMPLQEATYNLELLEKHDLVQRQPSWHDGESEWSLTPKGRTTLFASPKIQNP